MFYDVKLFWTDLSCSPNRLSLIIFIRTSTSHLFSFPCCVLGVLRLLVWRWRSMCPRYPALLPNGSGSGHFRKIKWKKWKWKRKSTLQYFHWINLRNQDARCTSDRSFLNLNVTRDTLSSVVTLTLCPIIFKHGIQGSLVTPDYFTALNPFCPLSLCPLASLIIPICNLVAHHLILWIPYQGRRGDRIDFVTIYSLPPSPNVT